MKVRPVSAIWAAICLAFALTGCSPEPRTARAANLKPDKDRKPAPSFALKDADGRVARPADYRGKVLLLDFWATWCGPCKIEIPWFMEFERSHKDRGFAVLGVSMDDDGWDSVKPFIRHLGINYRIVLGDDSTAQLYGGVEALPTTFLLDREGRIAAVHVGLATKREFEDDIIHLLEDSVARTDRARVPALFASAEFQPNP